MKLNMFVLAITSILQLIFILWHMFKYRGKFVAIAFIVFGFIFGILRSNIIHFIQISTNNSLLPYQFKDSLLQIGNDSLQVYVGWIIAAYYAWCVAELILKKQNNFFKIKNPELSIFAILSISFIFIASFSYMVETAASFMGWWSWNLSLESGFSSSLFINVPWVGIIDWATVAFEYLGVFLVTQYVIRTKHYKYLLILLFPILHWVSHINFGSFYWSIFGFAIIISVIAHLLIPVFAALAFYIQGPMLKKKDISYKFVWIALIIGILTCLLSDIIVGKSAISLLSVVPISLLLLMASGIKIKKVYYLAFAIAIAGLIIFTDLLTRKRIVMSLFPMGYLAFIYLFNLIIELYRHINKHQRIIFTSAFVLLIIIFGWLIVKPSFIVAQSVGTSYSVASISTNNKYMLIVTLDTTRNDHTGLGGYNFNTTPNLDSIGKTGTYFSNAYSPIPYTYPAHMSLFTGQYPKTTGIDYNASSEDNFSPTLAELFKNKGYATAAFVSSKILEKNGTMKGFDTFDYGDEVGLLPIDSVYRKAQDTNKKAFDWLDKNNKKPFFLWVHYYDAHQPYDTYCDKSFSLGKSPDHANYRDGLVNLQLPTPTANDLDYLLAKYDEELSCQDRQLGLLTDKLKELGIYNDTNIVIVGDHGENFDHNSFSHGHNLYESALRVPMVIKMDGLTGTKNTPVLLPDIFPTVVNKFGLDNNLKTDGYDLRSKDIANRKDLYFETTINYSENDVLKKVAVLRNQSKLMADVAGKGTVNLEAYDIAKDKNELSNIWDLNNTALNNLRIDLNTFVK